MFLGRETLEDHSQLPKKAKRWGWLQAFCMYGGIGMSASSLHRESTDSDYCTLVVNVKNKCRRNGIVKCINLKKTCSIL